METPAGLTGGLFAPENRQQLEASFKEFVTRPENRPLLEQQQAEEVTAALDALEMQQDAALAAEVQSLPTEYQQLLQPILKWPTLRRVLLSLARPAGPDVRRSTPTQGSSVQQQANPTSRFRTISSTKASSDRPSGNSISSAAPSPLAIWLGNDRVMALLRQITRALRSGQLTEQQLEQALLQQLSGETVWDMNAPRASDASSAAKQASNPCAQRPHVVLPSQLLMEALNEHLSERRTGSSAYQQQQWDVARHHYKRALAIVDFVRANSSAEQQEVDVNKASTLLNLAAVELAVQEYTAAARYCHQVLKMDPQQATALERLAKAQLGLHEHQAAIRTLQQLTAIDPHNPQLDQLKQRVQAAGRTSTQEKHMAARMLQLALD